MNILDHFTSIDDLLVTLLERIGGVTEEDTHFFSYPNDGTRATITKGTTKLDFMSGTVMTPAGVVTDLGNSLRARGREYCRSLSLQADRDIIIQIGTKSKIPVFAGTWFKVAHLRFTDVKIIAAESTQIFVIACTNPDSIEMAGEAYPRDPVDVWGQIKSMGNAELAIRTHSPPSPFDRRGDVIKWTDFETATPNYAIETVAVPVHGRSQEHAWGGDFSYKAALEPNDYVRIKMMTTDYHVGRIGNSVTFSAPSTPNAHIHNDLFVYDGTDLIQGTLSLNTVFGLDYVDSGGNFVNIDTTAYKRDADNFATFKLVIDLEKREYVRAVVFGSEYDLSGTPLKVSASATDPHLLSQVELANVVGISGVVFYVDNMILTENEPL